MQAIESLLPDKITGLLEFPPSDGDSTVAMVILLPQFSVYVKPIFLDGESAVSECLKDFGATMPKYGARVSRIDDVDRHYLSKWGFIRDWLKTDAQSLKKLVNEQIRSLIDPAMANAGFKRKGSKFEYVFRDDKTIHHLEIRLSKLNEYHLPVLGNLTTNMYDELVGLDATTNEFVVRFYETRFAFYDKKTLVEAVMKLKALLEFQVSQL